MTLQIKQNWPVYLIVIGLLVVLLSEFVDSLNKPDDSIIKEVTPEYWVAPSLYAGGGPQGEERRLIIYGEDLIANTARYFGPKGSVAQITNGMNCQNCHLNSGKKAWGNNYSSVFANYPKFRDRSGNIETIPKRVNDCFERSLNGKAIDTAGREMQAILGYIRWLGEEVEKGEKPIGSGIAELPFMSRAADAVRGSAIYAMKCESCHGTNGEGVPNGNGKGFIYPPLWGEHSYNTGAGLYRISRFAGFIKDNMPFETASHFSPELSDEEAWDIAAYVNSQPRPGRDLSGDWPDISKKPIDHPFGPFTDGFSEVQHKYGPFQPILEARKKQEEEKKLRPKSLTKE